MPCESHCDPKRDYFYFACLMIACSFAAYLAGAIYGVGEQTKGCHCKPGEYRDVLTDLNRSIRDSACRCRGQIGSPIGSPK